MRSAKLTRNCFDKYWNAGRAGHSVRLVPVIGDTGRYIVYVDGVRASTVSRSLDVAIDYANDRINYLEDDK